MDRKWPIWPGDPLRHRDRSTRTSGRTAARSATRCSAKLAASATGSSVKGCHPHALLPRRQEGPGEPARGAGRYYKVDGPPRIAIVVCSGTRLAPGVWSKRTIWYAAPRA